MTWRQGVATSAVIAQARFIGMIRISHHLSVFQLIG
jgi:hypothetical protein